MSQCWSNATRALSVLGVSRWLWVAGGIGVPLCAQEAQHSPSPPTVTQTVYLEYQTLPSRIKGWRLDVTSRTTPFKNEPDLAGRHVCRGTILAAFQGVQKPGEHFGNCINAPFLWDYTEGKLYLDLNRNGDLAGAPVFLTSEKAGYDSKPTRYYYQPFTNINLTFAPGLDAHPRLVDIHLYGYSGQDARGGNLTWHAFWQGKVSLQGRDLQIGLMEDVNHITTSQDGYLLLRPWTDRDRPFCLEDGSLAGFATGDLVTGRHRFPTNLFFLTRGYRLSFDYLKGDVARYKLDLTEVEPALGELSVQGRFINRLIFRQHQALSPFTVVLDSPDGGVKIPVGTYNNYDVFLKAEGAEAFRIYQNRSGVKPLISAANPAILRVGGPLTNCLAVRTVGRTLLLDYQLLGADGAYQMFGNNRTNPPHFTISQAGKQLATGTFEFG